jgi:hypothetical protein
MKKAACKIERSLLPPERLGMVALEIRCGGCGRLLLAVECHPAADAVGILTCRQCKLDQGFDLTDQMALECGL